MKLHSELGGLGPNYSPLTACPSLSDLYCLTVSVGELGPGTGLLFGHKEELWLYWDAGSSEGGLRKLPGQERVKGKSGFVYNTEEWGWQRLGVSAAMWGVKYRVFCSVLICRCFCPSLHLQTSCTGACMGLEGRGVWGRDSGAHRQMQVEDIPETTRRLGLGLGLSILFIPVHKIIPKCCPPPLSSVQPAGMGAPGLKHWEARGFLGSCRDHNNVGISIY